LKKIIYISDLSESEPLFHSQVIPHVTELRKRFDVTLMVLVRDRKARLHNGSYFYYSSVKGDYSYYLAKVAFLNQKKKIRSVVTSKKFDLIYSRGIRGGLVGCLIKKYLFSNRIMLLNDTRGYPFDGMRQNFLNKTILNHSNKMVFDNSHILFLVSHYLKKKICRDYGFNIHKAFVFPTFVADHKFDFKEENRKSVRKELGLTSTEVVICYSGSLEKYQNVETILSALKSCSNPTLKMLVLTKDKRMTTLAKKYGLSDGDKIKIKSVNYDSIEKYYHAADFGILIRDNTETNKSAAPTKFSEYVNAGLGLIINHIEADYIQIFKEKKLEGYLLEKKEDLLNCFNSITTSSVKRNVSKINTVGELVRRQDEILDNCIFTEHNSGCELESAHSPLI